MDKIDLLKLKEIEEYLKNLPDQRDPDYVQKLIKLVESETPALKDHLKNILQNNTERKEKDEYLAFNTFYALMVYYRRYKYFSEQEHLIYQYQSSFLSQPLFNVALSTMYKNKGTSADYELALNYARKAVEEIPKHKGILQNFADIVVTGLENSEFVSDDTIQEAKQSIDQAIMIDPKYAKYYCTRGRILAFLGKYGRAKQDVQYAIDLEDANKSDYSIRIGDYQYHLLSIKSLEVSESINKTVSQVTEDVEKYKDDMEDSVKDLLTKNLEFLAFFAAILSFTIGSIQMASRQSFEDAAALIIVLSGSLLVVYTSFRLLLRDFRFHYKQSAVLIAIGFTLIILGFILGIGLLQN